MLIEKIPKQTKQINSNNKNKLQNPKVSVAVFILSVTIIIVLEADTHKPNDDL